jgi:cold shock protein
VFPKNEIEPKGNEMQGRVNFFHIVKGFGFICDDDGNDVFFHVSNIVGRAELGEGDEVEFETGVSKRRNRTCRFPASGFPT